MFNEARSRYPRRLMKPPSNYVPDEVIMTAKKAARNDDLPHYLNVSAGTSVAATSYGDASIDGVLHRLGLSSQSVARVFVPKPVVTGLAPTAGAAALALSTISAEYLEDEDKIGMSRTYRIRFQTDVNVPQVCKELLTSNAVEEARPNFISEILKQPNDEFYGYQWGLTAIDCEEGWEIETGHPDVVIAVVDSGVDLQHDDLTSKLKQGYDFVDFQGSEGWRYALLGDYRVRDEDPDDEDGHGTHCAGIAAAESGNGRGVAGVCWGGWVLPVRVMFRVYDRLMQRETSVGTDADIDAGIKFAVDSGAQVTNLSLGGGSPSHETVLEYAYDRNVCILAATGNENTNKPSYPASHPRTLAVGAIDANFNRAGFSNYGPAYNRFVMAPGVDIASTYKDNSYVYLNGTSMATPFVTGLAALIVSLAIRNGKKLSVNDVYEIIRETATSLGSGKGDRFYGEGLINAPAALRAAKEKLGCTQE